MFITGESCMFCIGVSFSGAGYPLLVDLFCKWTSTSSFRIFTFPDTGVNAGMLNFLLSLVCTTHVPTHCLSLSCVACILRDDHSAGACYTVCWELPAGRQCQKELMQLLRNQLVFCLSCRCPPSLLFPVTSVHRQCSRSDGHSDWVAYRYKLGM